MIVAALMAQPRRYSESACDYDGGLDDTEDPSEHRLDAHQSQAVGDAVGILRATQVWPSSLPATRGVVMIRT